MLLSFFVVQIVKICFLQKLISITVGIVSTPLIVLNSVVSDYVLIRVGSCSYTNLDTNTLLDYKLAENSFVLLLSIHR